MPARLNEREGVDIATVVCVKTKKHTRDDDGGEEKGVAEHKEAAERKKGWGGGEGKEEPRHLRVSRARFEPRRDD